MLRQSRKYNGMNLCSICQHRSGMACMHASSGYNGSAKRPVIQMRHGALAPLWCPVLGEVEQCKARARSTKEARKHESN